MRVRHGLLRALMGCVTILSAVTCSGCQYPGPEPRPFADLDAREDAIASATWSVVATGLRGRARYLSIYLALQTPRQDLDRLATTLAWTFYHSPNESVEVIDPDGQALSFHDISGEHRDTGMRVNIHGTPKFVVPFRPPDTVRATLTCWVVPEQPLRPGATYRCRLNRTFLRAELSRIFQGEIAVIGDWRDCHSVTVEPSGGSDADAPWSAKRVGG